MSIAGKYRAWMRASLHAATFAGMVLIAASWGIAGFVSYVEHQKAVEGMLHQSEDMVRLFEQNTLEVLERIDRTLLLLRNSYEEDPKHFELRSWATRTALLIDETFQITLIGASGFQLASTTDDMGPPLYLGDREYFRKQQLGLSSDKLFISEPVLGRASAKLSLQFSRRVRAPDGGFGGVIVASIDPNFIGRFFRTINPGQTGSIILRDLNGVILAAQGVPSSNIGRLVRPQAYLDALARSTSGYYWGRSAFDDNRRLMAYRATEKFPLVFAVGLAESDGLGDYQKIRTNYFVAAVILSLAILAAMAMNIRRQLVLDNSQARLGLLNAEIAEQNFWFDAALANMSAGLSMFDAEGMLLVWNDRYVEIYGMAQEFIRRGVAVHEILEHQKAAGYLELDVDADIGEFWQQLADHGKSTSHCRLSDGRVVAIASTAIEGGGWVSTHEDVTEQKRADQLIAEKAAELEHINMQFDVALSNMSQGICMFDRDRRLVVWNDRYEELFRLPPLKKGTHVEDILAEIFARNLLKNSTNMQVHETVATVTSDFRTDIASSRLDEFADGRVILISRQPMKEGGWVSTYEDVTERKRAETEIAHMARHDALTGLANRAEFNVRLDEASKRMQRNGTPVTVLMLDLDKFKAVNDTLGHPAGDQLLVEVGKRLQSTLRETDLLARLGGDEFAIIQEGGTNQREGAGALAERIISLISEPFDLGGQLAIIGTSVGIAMAPEHGVDPEQLMTAADLALYEAKAGGRNDFQVFQASMLEVARTRKSAENELREAIEHNEFELHYQPVVDVNRHVLCGVEALVRWRHPTKGLVAPDQFIPLAESTGLIAPLGEWIIWRACTDAALLPEHVRIAVNVSAVQFRKGNLFDIIRRVLAETGLSPHRIELEITETFHLENQEAHLATMRKLKEIGISMVLDDFGTGYSSINYLTSFPFDKIKIDKSFTQGALDRNVCAAIVASTLALAKGLGIVTTAEGVETEQQFEHMRDSGVDMVQGYLFGRPVPISDFGAQSAITLEALCRLAKPRIEMPARKREIAKRRA